MGRKNLEKAKKGNNTVFSLFFSKYIDSIGFIDF